MTLYEPSRCPVIHIIDKPTAQRYIKSDFFIFEKDGKYYCKMCESEMEIIEVLE